MKSLLPIFFIFILFTTNDAIAVSSIKTNNTLITLNQSIQISESSEPKASEKRKNYRIWNSIGIGTILLIAIILLIKLKKNI